MCSLKTINLFIVFFHLVTCAPNTQVKIGWLLRLSECIDEFYLNEDQLPGQIFKNIYEQPNIVLQDYDSVAYMKSKLSLYHCEDVSSIIDIYVI